MEYILFLTYRCNLNCAYCFAKNLIHDENKNNISITHENIEKVCKYIENDINSNNRKDNSIVFFGGEPSLVPDIILDIMERTSHLNLNYSIYTNGLLLDKLPDALLKNLQSILVAIDGDKNSHETYKPMGSYEKILGNLNIIKGKTAAQTIGRITMEENTNIYQSVKNLLNHFDYVHWQIVNKESFDNPEMMIQNYSTNIRKLFFEWKEMFNSGMIMNIIPFNRIILSLLTDEKHNSFRCGCGSSIQTIDINGNIYICDEYIENQNNSIGNISDNKYDLIRYKNHYELFDDCVKCEVSSICLGRCRKSLETQSPDRIKVYCALTKVLLSIILASLDEIKQIIFEHRSNLEKLHTEIYDTEIIP